MQKNIHGGLKEWLLVLMSILLFLAVLILPFRWAVAAELTDEEQKLLQAWQKGELIRLHVIANSDSEEDQFIKLRVRDALIEAFGKTLAEKGNISSDAIYRALEQNAALMQETALACAQTYGFAGAVSAEVGLLQLPEKRYGNVVLPEGEYRALRITLGDGAGQNWWCVLFPQLCLSLAETDEPSSDELRWSSERIFRNWMLMGC